MKLRHIRIPFYFWLLPVAVMAGIYAFTVWRYTINFPFWDDYFALLDFIDVQITEPSIAIRIAALFEQHYEHRVVTGRLIAWAWYGVNGAVNFRALVFIGNAFYFVWFYWLTNQATKRNETTWIGIIILAAFTFSINQWDVSSWATTALFFYSIDLLALTAIICYFSASKYAILLAWLAGLLATFSGANGIIIFPAIAIADLLIRGWLPRRFITWAIGSIAAVALYSWGYIRPEHQPSIIGTLWQQPTMAARYFLVLTGNVFDAGKNMALAWGLICLMLAAYILYKKVWKKSPILFSIWLFLLLTLLAITAGRTAAGAGQAFTLRYISYSSIYSGLLLVLCLSIVPAKFRRICTALFVTIAIIGFTNSYFKMAPMISYNRTSHLANMIRIKNQQLSNFNYGSEFDNDSLSKAWLRRYDSLQIFSFRFTDEKIIFSRIPETKETHWTLNQLMCEDKGHFYSMIASFDSKSPNDTIHFTALSILKPNGETGWRAIMRPMYSNPTHGRQQFEVNIMKLAWPFTVDSILLEITDEQKKMVIPYQLSNRH
jgi:hypothetical protein